MRLTWGHVNHRGGGETKNLKWRIVTIRSSCVMRLTHVYFSSNHSKYPTAIEKISFVQKEINIEITYFILLTRSRNLLPKGAKSILLPTSSMHKCSPFVLASQSFRFWDHIIPCCLSIFYLIYYAAHPLGRLHSICITFVGN